MSEILGFSSPILIRPRNPGAAVNGFGRNASNNCLSNRIPAYKIRDAMTPYLAEVAPAIPVPPVAQTWIMVAGLCFLGLAAIFLVVTIVMAMFGRTIPPGSQPLMAAFLALCAGTGAGFLGSDAKLTGHIPLPFAATHPLSFGIGGGAAVMLVVWIIADQLITRASRKGAIPDQRITSFSANYPEGTPLSDAIRLFCGAQQTQYAVRFEPDEKPFKSRCIAIGEVRAKSIAEMVMKMTRHLAQGSSPIRVKITQPRGQSLLVVTTRSA
jgi:hypothetical protein